jgi:CO dehydrogenase maturation factor
VDVLFIVSDATVRGITTAGRVAALLGELETKVGRHYLIVNRAADGLTPALEAEIAEQGLELLTVLPDDLLVAEYDAAGKALIGLPADSALIEALAPVVTTMLAQLEGKEAAGAHHR